MWKAAKPIVDLGKKHGILTASYGGQTPVARVPGGPVDPVLSTIRERLEKTRGAPVSAGQVLSKWLLQKGAIVITYAQLSFPHVRLSLICSLFLSQDDFEAEPNQRIPRYREGS